MLRKGKEYSVRVEKEGEMNPVKDQGGLTVVQERRCQDVWDRIFVISRHSKGNDLRPKGVLYFALMEYWLSFLIPFVLFRGRDDSLIVAGLRRMPIWYG